MTKYIPSAEDIVGEMIERSESMVYMLEALRKEINLLPELTGLNDEVFYSSLLKCLNTVELIAYSNLEKLQRDEGIINTQYSINATTQGTKAKAA